MNISLKEVAKYIPILWKNNVVPFLHSSPAQGKSSLVKQIADNYDLEVIDLRLTELDPTDISGLPFFNAGKAEFMPFDTFPLQGTKLPENKYGWVLLLDEFSSANLQVQASAYRLVLDRQVGQHKLHDDVYIIACGNLETDNAIVNPMSSALISRFAHFNIELSFDDWIMWAYQNNIDQRITSYLNFKNTALYTFNPDNTEPYASPRTWEMLSRVINDIKTNDLTIPLVSSLVGDGIAMEFISHAKLFNQLIDFNDIIKNPTNTPIPSELSIAWATISMVANKIDVSNYQTVIKYVERFGGEFIIMFLKEVKGRDISLFTKLGMTPQMLEFIKQLTKDE